MSKQIKFLALSVILVVVAAGAGLFWFLGGDSPDEVSLEAATQQLSDDDAAADTSTGDVEVATTGEIEGVWTVDTESGDFDYETATGSFVGFRIEEELSGLGSVTAVGRTGDVDGSITIDGSALTAATFEVDMTTITTEDSRRDDNVQDAIESSEFPTASFVLSEPIELGDGAAEGDALAVDATGELTIHGVTQLVTIPLQAQLVGETVVVVGSIDITFSDYDVEVPESQIVISVEDSGTMEFQLLFTR